MSTSHQFRITLWNNATNGLLTGYGGHVYIALVTQSVAQAVPLSEDGNNQGTYILGSVAGGLYKVYVDADKSGSPVEGDLKISQYQHGVGPDNVSDINIEDFTIALDDLSQEVIDYIQNNGGSTAPDGVTLELNPSNQMRIKDAGVSQAKIADNSINAAKLMAESVSSAKLAPACLAPSHFTSNVVPAGALTTGNFDATEFEKDVTGFFRLKNGAIRTAKLSQEVIDLINAGGITLNPLEFENINDTWYLKGRGITAGKIAVETITEAELSDEVLIARHFSADQIDATMLHPTSSMDTAQFERTGTPLKWKLKAAGVGGDILAAWAVSSDLYNNVAPQGINGGNIKGDAFDNTEFEQDGGSGNWALKNLGVTTAKVADASITLAKLAAEVTTAITESGSFVNVLDHGADPTGIASSSQAFDDAMDFANANSQTYVYVPKGTYLVKNVRIHPNTTLLAEGATITYGGSDPETIDRYEAKNAIFHIWGADINNQCNNVRIQGGTLIGNRPSGYTEQTDFDILNTAFCKNLGLHFIKFQDAGRNAVEAKRPEKLTIIDCDFLGIAGKGIKVTACNGLKISRASITESRDFLQAVNQANTAESTNILVDRSDIKVFQNAFDFQTVRNVRIDLNNIEGINFASQLANQFLVVKSTAAQNPLNGNVTDVYFTNNAIRNFSDSAALKIAGIFQCAFVQTNFLFTGNALDSCGTLLFNDCDDILFQGNYITNADLGDDFENALILLGSTARYGLNNNHIHVSSRKCAEITVSANGLLLFANNYISAAIQFSVDTANKSAVIRNNDIFGELTAITAFNTQFTGNRFKSTGTALRTNADDNLIRTNSFDNAAVAVDLQASSERNFVQGNTFKNCSITVQNNGTNNNVVDNYTL